jgi:hypothetical protein
MRCDIKQGSGRSQVSREFVIFNQQYATRENSILYCPGTSVLLLGHKLTTEL